MPCIQTLAVATPAEIGRLPRQVVVDLATPSGALELALSCQQLGPYQRLVGSEAAGSRAHGETNQLVVQRFDEGVARVGVVDDRHSSCHLIRKVDELLSCCDGHEQK
jgi:hypothetical protein